MSTGKKSRRVRRSFKFIFRLIQLIFALVFVFLASFFVTLAWRSPDTDKVEDKKIATTETSIGEKIDRIFDIEKAVNDKRKKIRHYVLFLIFCKK